MRNLILAARRRLLPNSWRNEADAAWAGWRDGLWSYRLFRLTQKDRWLRRAFQELAVMDGIWNGEVDLPKVPHLRLFDVAAKVGSSAAKQASSTILEGLRDPTERNFVRLLLAARAVQIYDNFTVADAIFNSASPDPEVKLERLFLSALHGPPDANDRRLIAELLAGDRTPKAKILNAWLRSSWLFDGASEPLLREATDFLGSLPRRHTKVLARETLALALQLDDRSVVRKLLDENPGLASNFSSILPLASFLLSENLASRSDRKSVAEYAELYQKMQLDTLSLLEMIKDTRRSLAVVGNSPCEMGLGRGPIINAHELVARFNVFSTSDEFAADYGTKCDIHIRSLPEDEKANEFSRVTDTIVLSRADLIYRNRQWKNVLDLARSGAKLSAFPTGFHQGLYKKLGGAPSSGLAFCALVRQQRGVLSRSSCFGFAFVDQIGTKRTSAHYFREARPSFNHQWKREKEMFDELTGVSSAREGVTRSL